LIRDVRRFGIIPWFQVAIVVVDLNHLPNGALPVVSAEPWKPQPKKELKNLHI